MTHLEDLTELMEKFINRPILVYGDPDVDGVMSMLLICQYLDMRGYSYSYYINSDRRHGFDLDPVALSGYFIIAVDFGVSREFMQRLVDNNVSIICLDHHKIEDDYIRVSSGYSDAEGILLNNQYSFEPEDDRYQSGAGVVYEALSTCYPDFKSKDREAIVGITLLSDARPIENLKARKYLNTIYSADPQTGYIGYLVRSVITSDYNFGLPRMDRNFIDYTFSPVVNALLRFDKETEAIDFILGKGITNESLSLKKVQLNLVSAMKERAMRLEMPNVTFIGVDANGYKDFGDVNMSNFIGLLCSNIKGVGKSVLGFVIDNGRVVRASFRGRYDDLNYLSHFQEMGIDAHGHPPAFGILNFNPTHETWQQINDMIGEIDKGHNQTVKVYKANNLNMFLTQKGWDLANENCYVRDMFRHYIDYTGSGAREIKRGFKKVPFEPDDYTRGTEIAEKKRNGECYKYLLDENGNKVVSYIEYMVDGKKVKSFGLELSKGYILPILERGYIQLYVRDKIS